MLSFAKWNRISAAKLASALDEAAACCSDSMALRRLIRLKNLVLDSRAEGLGARRADQAALEKVLELQQQLRSGMQAWEIMHQMNRIEALIYAREQKSGEDTELVMKKRELFEQLRALAYEIDWLENKRTQILRQSISVPDDQKNSYAAELFREDYVACVQWLEQVTAQYEMTRQTIRSMNTVHMLRIEESSLAQLERDRAMLPTVSEMNAMMDRIEDRIGLNGERANATEALRREWASISSGSGFPEENTSNT